MELTTVIIDFVRELGFPVACCFLLWKNNTDTLKEVTSSIGKNTIVLEKILTVLDIHEDSKK